MPVLTDTDFQRLAQAAATDLVQNDVPLSDSVDKLASAYGMNDEQLRRLCESTNNATFNAVFEAKGKTASADRFVDFEIADASKILRARMGAEKTAATVLEVDAAVDPSEYLPLASTRHQDVPFSKTASELPFDERPTDKVRRDLAGRHKLAAAVEHLRIEKVAAEQQYGYALGGLVDQFRKYYNATTFEAFEKEAMAVHGVPADTVLDHLRADLGKPAVSRDGHAKLAAYMVVDTGTVLHGMFKTALDHWTRISHIEQVLNAKA